MGIKDIVGMLTTLLLFVGVPLFFVLHRRRLASVGG